MREKNFISIAVVLFLISLIPLSVAAEHQSHDSIMSTGYGEAKIFGILPRVSGDTVTLFMVLPPFGKITINKLYFNGHLGLLFIYGDYNWMPQGPPAFSTSVR
jgi:hypothetical protein